MPLVLFSGLDAYFLFWNVVHFVTILFVPAGEKIKCSWRSYLSAKTKDPFICVYSRWFQHGSILTLQQSFTKTVRNENSMLLPPLCLVTQAVLDRDGLCCSSSTAATYESVLICNMTHFLSSTLLVWLKTLNWWLYSAFRIFTCGLSFHLQSRHTCCLILTLFFSFFLLGSLHFQYYADSSQLRPQHPSQTVEESFSRPFNLLELNRDLSGPSAANLAVQCKSLCLDKVLSCIPLKHQYILLKKRRKEWQQNPTHLEQVDELSAITWRFYYMLFHVMRTFSTFPHLHRTFGEGFWFWSPPMSWWISVFVCVCPLPSVSFRLFHSECFPISRVLSNELLAFNMPGKHKHSK